MNSTLRLFSPAPLRHSVISLLLAAAAYLVKMAVWLGHKVPHTGGQLLAPDADAIRVQPAIAAQLGFNKAAILQKVYEWMLHNEARNKRDHLINGEWYTYRSADEWRVAHFPWMATSTVKRLFQELETDDKLLLSIQHRKERGDCRKWVTIPRDARAKIAAMGAVTPSAQKTPTPIQNALMPESDQSMAGAKESPTNGNLQLKNLQIKNPKTEQQQQLLHSAETETGLALETDVVAVADPLPRPTIEAESGEYSIKAEAVPTDREDANGEPLAVEAGHKNDSTTTTLSKVPLKVLSPLAHELLVDFGILPTDAASLIDKYGEAHIRAGIRRTYAAKNVESPAGFLIAALRKNDLLIAADLAPVQKLMRDPVEEERMAAIRRQNEIWAAEEAALAAEQSPPFDDMLIPAVPDASERDELHGLRTDRALV